MSIAKRTSALRLRLVPLAVLALALAGVASSHQPSVHDTVQKFRCIHDQLEKTAPVVSEAVEYDAHPFAPDSDSRAQSLRLHGRTPSSESGSGLRAEVGTRAPMRYDTILLYK